MVEIFNGNLWEFREYESERIKKKIFAFLKNTKKKLIFLKMSEFLAKHFSQFFAFFRFVSKMFFVLILCLVNRKIIYARIYQRKFVKAGGKFNTFRKVRLRRIAKRRP